VSYASALIEPSVFVVVWDLPVIDDVNAILKECRSHQQTIGRDLCYLGIVQEHSPPPDEDTRGAMTANFAEMAQVCSSINLVFHGGIGVELTRIRSDLASTFLVGNPRMGIHTDIEVALREAGFDGDEFAQVRAQVVKTVQTLGRGRHGG